MKQPKEECCEKCKAYASLGRFKGFSNEPYCRYDYSSFCPCHTYQTINQTTEHSTGIGSTRIYSQPSGLSWEVSQILDSSESVPSHDRKEWIMAEVTSLFYLKKQAVLTELEEELSYTEAIKIKEVASFGCAVYQNVVNIVTALTQAGRFVNVTGESPWVVHIYERA